MGIFLERKIFKVKNMNVKPWIYKTNLKKMFYMSFRCPLAAWAEASKNSSDPCFVTPLKSLSRSSSLEAQRWLDDEYRGKSIPLSKQYSGVITSFSEEQEDQIFIIFHKRSPSTSPTSWFNKVKYWSGYVWQCGLWCFILIIRNKGKASQRAG